MVLHWECSGALPVQLGGIQEAGVPFRQLFQKSLLYHSGLGYLWCTPTLGNPRFFSSLELDQRLPGNNQGMLWCSANDSPTFALELLHDLQYANPPPTDMEA